MEDISEKQQIRRIYDQAFGEDKGWNDRFFDRLYDDAEAVTVSRDDRIVSSLFLHRYGFLFHGEELPSVYISGAATERRYRHRGLMGEAMREALRRSSERGDVVASLIPASRRLFFYYDKFGFSTVVYSDIERYTSVHAFTMDQELTVTAPRYESMAEMERKREAAILHSRKDFDLVMEDITHDGGRAVEIDDAEGRPLAMAFATANDTEIHVKELLGSYARARETALFYIKNELGPDKSVLVYRLPTERQATLRARGMIRIVDVERLLASLVARHPGMRLTIKVSDGLIEKNNGVFRLDKGECRRVTDAAFDESARESRLETSVEVLARILFNGPSVGDIFGLPTARPAVQLMLD